MTAVQEEGVVVEMNFEVASLTANKEKEELLVQVKCICTYHHQVPNRTRPLPPLTIVVGPLAT